MDTIVRVGGAAGDGVASTGQVVARSFSRLGYHVNAYNSYQSVIRGGHVWYNARASDEPIGSIGDAVDVLVAVDRQTADVHAPLLREGGVVIHDEAKVDLSDLETRDGVTMHAVPASETAKEIGSPLMANMVAVGAVSHVIGLDEDVLKGVVRDQFGHKGEKMIEMNFQALAKGQELASDIDPIRTTDRRGDAMPLVAGNEALALGSMAAGLGYYAAYPMTPASTILHYLAKVGPGQGVVVKQMEDEIGVVNSTIGAAFAGARSMCGTSGGGFALMTEAIGFAAMAEVGIVVVNSMRGGPSTGLPTKTEQADLFQMLGAGQGDFPKAILAPQSPADAYRAAVEAHEIADQYQMPVFLAMDFYLSETMQTVPEPFPTIDSVDRGAIAGANGDGFKRYLDTPTGVSPRSWPGMEGLDFVGASDEHDEDATLISDTLAGLPNSLKVRDQQVRKRARKLDTLLKELDPPAIEGDEGPLLVCWGSTGPVVREARSRMASDSTPTRQLTLRWIHPFHSDEVKTMLTDEPFYVVEASYSGQLEDYIRMRTGLSAAGHVRRFDGEPFTPDYVLEAFQEVAA